MPALISFTIWKSKTQVINAFKQSPELKALTKAFELYSMRKTPARLEDFRNSFKNWQGGTSSAISTEKRTLGNAVADLTYTIANVATVSTPRVTKAIGWKVVPWTSPPYTWTQAVPLTDKQGDLKSVQILQINEAFSRAKKAARIARDALTVLKPSAFTESSLSFTAQCYVDYFGPYDETRFKTVQKNLGFLFLAFNDATHTPNVIDLRDTLYGKTCYAACFRKDLRASVRGSIASLTGHVDIFLGRSFFLGSVGGKGKASYSTSSDATVVTLVHEFAHGTINAVDAPPVDVNNNWVLQPEHQNDPSHADYGSTPNNSVQASTTDDDKKLAIKSPDIAIRSADSYGQFAKEHLLNMH